MIRCRIGLIVLAILLALGILSGLFMKHIHSDISHNLDKAAQLAAASKLEDAAKLIRQAKQNWERHRHLIASLADHADTDDIDSLFQQLAVYQKRNDATSATATCTELSSRLQVLGESHNIYWWNLL